MHLQLAEFGQVGRASHLRRRRFVGAAAASRGARRRACIVDDVTAIALSQNFDAAHAPLGGAPGGARAARQVAALVAARPWEACGKQNFSLRLARKNRIHWLISTRVKNGPRGTPRGGGPRGGAPRLCGSRRWTCVERDRHETSAKFVSRGASLVRCIDDVLAASEHRRHHVQVPSAEPLGVTLRPAGREAPCTARPDGGPRAACRHGPLGGGCWCA